MASPGHDDVGISTSEWRPVDLTAACVPDAADGTAGSGSSSAGGGQTGQQTTAGKGARAAAGSAASSTATVPQRRYHVPAAAAALARVAAMLESKPLGLTLTERVVPAINWPNASQVRAAVSSPTCFF